MTQVTMTWHEFLTEATEFLKISQSLDDNWELFKKNEREGNTFLKYKRKLQINLQNNNSTKAELGEEPGIAAIADECTATNKTVGEVFLIEYHVLYSISYQVPMLYLKIQKSDGSSVELEEAWNILASADESIKGKTRNELLEILTQMEHPVLFIPFYAIHPCKTSELLGQMPQSENRILTFISLMGPFVKLKVDNRYGVRKNNLFRVKTGNGAKKLSAKK